MEWESCSGDEEEDYEDITDTTTDDEASSSSHFQNSHADSSDVNSLLSGADPATNVMIREGRMQQDEGTHRFIENYDDEERNEQTCQLCNQPALPIRKYFVHNNERYIIIWKQDLKDVSRDPEWGYLQCCYCFDFYHRHKCTLLMTDEQFIKKTVSRSWVCPSCVPEYVPFVKKACKSTKSARNKCVSLDEILIAVLKYLYLSKILSGGGESVNSVLFHNSISCVRQLTFDVIFEYG
jgi:hypothetical protein